jgi:hypothetical protein
MKLAVMQPYFFPYIGYFELINRTDKWVVLDNVQYLRRGWMNRNRIIHPSGNGWTYLTVPVQKAHHEVAIKDVLVVPDQGWKQGLLRQVLHYRKRAPFFEPVYELFERALAPDELSLSKFNVHALKLTCDYLGIDFAYEFFSEMDLPIGEIHESGDWPLRIAEALKATEYINPPGGIDLYDPVKFQASGIKLTIQKLVQFRYECEPFEYTPALSILDVCMWNSPQEIKAFLDSYSYEAQAA